MSPSHKMCSKIHEISMKNSIILSKNLTGEQATCSSLRHLDASNLKLVRNPRSIKTEIQVPPSIKVDYSSEPKVLETIYYYGNLTHLEINRIVKNFRLFPVRYVFIFPEIVSPSLRHVSVQGNTLWYIDFELHTTALRKIQWLHLQNNEMEFIGPNVIGNMTSVKYLNLANNLLNKMLQNNSFKKH